MHSIDVYSKNKPTRINNRFWLEIIVEPLAQKPHMYSHIDSDCGQVFVLLILQMFAWWCYRVHYVHKRKHSSRMPGARFSTVRASQWTSLNRSGWGGSLYSEVQVAQVWTCPVGLGQGWGGGQWSLHAKFQCIIDNGHLGPPLWTDRHDWKITFPQLSWHAVKIRAESNNSDSNSLSYLNS